MSFRLKHPVRQGDWMFYHYEGELHVRDSILEVPDDLPGIARHAWVKGFRFDADTGSEITDWSVYLARRAEPEPDPEPAPAAAAEDEPKPAPVLAIPAAKRP